MKVRIKAGSFEHDGWINAKAPEVEIEAEKSIPELNVNLFCGDSLSVLKTIADNSIDSVVCDPPYGLSKEPNMAEVINHWIAGDDYTHKGGGFMGKKWDSFVPGPSIWRECLRVLKPGGHLLAFFGSRTYDMGSLAIRLAGFEIRDQIMWIYGSGFPKSLDIHKATGLEEWEGWGTALKPAHEPICVARKPLSGTVAANVMEHGTGGLNIDGCRVATDENLNGGAYAEKGGRSSLDGDERTSVGKGMFEDGRVTGKIFKQPDGRWPANLVHDGSDEVLEAFPDAKGQQGALTGNEPSFKMGSANCYGKMEHRQESVPRIDSSKNAARFFYCAKASKADRNYGLSGEDIGSTELVGREQGSAGINNPRAGAGRTSGSKNPHPTVKPIALMEWLVKLVTPVGGITLDPFMGSGSTGIAAVKNGYRFIGIELGQEYFDIADERINFVVKNNHED